MWHECGYDCRMNARTSVALEIIGIALAALVFVATFQIRPSYVDFALAAVAVGLIVASTSRSRRFWESAPRAVSGPRSPLVAAAMDTAIFTAVALVALATAAAIFAPGGTEGTEPWFRRLVTAHFLIALLLYFPWALLQQFIFQYYLFGRLLQLVSAPVAVAITALGFASVHFPRWPVMAVTVLAGAFWSLTYYRHRRLLPLAASHAILGAALHYWVFGRDLLESWTLF
jgi:membrane protease YdiL (CAAX protease family)